MDEVGRGPWAGPLVACALIFKKTTTNNLKGLKDSKKLTVARRERFFKVIARQAVYGIGIAQVWEIDKLGLVRAINLVFKRAISQLPIKPDFLLVDGMDKLKLPYPFCTIIKGDEKIKIIACASIIAKVARDRIMREEALRYPQYGFEYHKGYGTRRHAGAIKQYGICALHRRSFKPIASILACSRAF